MMSDLQQTCYLDAQQLSGLTACKLQASVANSSIDLSPPDQEAVNATISPPLSPRSVSSTPGQSSDTFPPILRHFAPSRQCSRDRQRFSHDVPYGQSWGRNCSQAASSTYSSSSSCSIVRAIAGLGLEGPCAGGSDSLSSCPSFSRRGSISKAKKILAEAINSVPGAHGMASCTSSAADTGVLSPLLSIIRSNGVSRGPADSNRLSRNSTSAMRRSSFTETGWGSSSLYSLGDSRSQRVQRRSSFSEAAGGLECEDSVMDDSVTAGATISSSLGSWRCSSSSMSQVSSLSGCMLLSPAQQQQKVVDCLETVRYLAMDDSNRVALIDLGAVELLLSKLQPGAKSTPNPAPAVVEAALSALTVLGKHDVTRVRVWESAHSTALLQLLSSRRTSPQVKAAHLCVANLAWSCEHDRHQVASSGSSVFDSVSSHPCRDDATSTTSSSYSSNVLLAPSLVSAVAAGLHPSAQVPVLLSLLKLLNKAASSSCLAPFPVPSCCSSSCLSESSGDQLCSVAHPHDAGSSWRHGWQQAVFALPPLLVASMSRQGSSEVLTAALEVLVTLTEQHPELHTVLCAAGCLQPLLRVMLTSSTSSECRLQAACVLSSLVDCAEVVEQLRQESALRLLLRALDEQQNSLDVRLAILHILRRLSTASQPCVEVLKAQGAVQVVMLLLQQLHTKEVKRAAAGLLRLLGKQVVARSSKLHKGSNTASTSSTYEGCSDRSSFESTCSVDSQMKHSNVYWPTLGREPVHQEMRGSDRKLSQHLQSSHLHTTPPCYLHAH